VIRSALGAWISRSGEGAVVVDLLLPHRALLTHAALLSGEFPRPQPLVAGILDAGTGAILAGPPGVGKT
jgi:hypothetical protein